LFKTGDVIKNRYEVKKELGHGGQVIVYLCDDRENHGTVVLKECIFKGMSSEDRARELELFEKEALILKAITHLNLPKVYEFFREGESHLIAEEHIDGTPLDRILKKQGALPEEKVLDAALQMTSLLTHLHGNDPPVIIRDIKPSNIMLTEDGHLYFIDFTIARYAVKDKEDTVRMGSPGYAPPEQYRGLSTPQTDIYSLGVTIHQMLTGHDPLNSPFMLPSACSLKPNLLPEWDSLISTACELTPEKRYASAAEMEKDLHCIRDILAQGPSARKAIRSAQRPGPLQTALRVVMLLIFIGAFALAGLIVKGRYDCINVSDCFQNMTVICNAIEAYSDENGAVPESLGRLTPGYLKAIPSCPQSGFPSYVLEVLDRREEQVGRDLYGVTTYRIICRGPYHRSFFRGIKMPYKTVTHRSVTGRTGSPGQRDGHQ
jgi:tRNA A-37 threonylcarbamoyl transferase component Bud32